MTKIEGTFVLSDGGASVVTTTTTFWARNIKESVLRAGAVIEGSRAGANVKERKPKK